MAGFWETIRELPGRMLGGGNDTERRLKALDAMEKKFVSARRDNEDSIQSLKEEIKNLEARALKKKQELDQAHGDSRRIVAGEIERMFRELDRLGGREAIVTANLERIGLALAKVGEARAGLRAGVSEQQFDEIALEMQELVSELKTLDRASVDLEREKYEAPATGRVDVSERMAEVTGEQETAMGLSPETQKWLKQLETE